MSDPHRHAETIIRLNIAAGILLLACYIFFSIFGPIARSWGDLLTNLEGILTVGAVAVLATLIWRQYRTPDVTTSIWMFLALGMWAWFLADVVWGIYNLTLDIVPKVSWADLFYLMGYVFVPIALHRQYKVLFRPSLRRDLLVTGSISAAIVITAVFFTWAISGFIPRDMNLASFLNILYPMSDVAIALVALVYVTKFGHGALARPWIGLIVFAAADGLYAWLIESETYAYSVIHENLASLISDSLYVTAYLTMAVLLLNHFLLLKYGPSIVRRHQAAANS